MEKIEILFAQLEKINDYMEFFSQKYTNITKILVDEVNSMDPLDRTLKLHTTQLQ